MLSLFVAFCCCFFTQNANAIPSYRYFAVREPRMDERGLAHNPRPMVKLSRYVPIMQRNLNKQTDTITLDFLRVETHCVDTVYGLRCESAPSDLHGLVVWRGTTFLAT